MWNKTGTNRQIDVSSEAIGENMDDQEIVGVMTNLESKKVTNELFITQTGNCGEEELLKENIQTVENEPTTTGNILCTDNMIFSGEKRKRDESVESEPIMTSESNQSTDCEGDNLPSCSKEMVENTPIISESMKISFEETNSVVEGTIAIEPNFSGKELNDDSVVDMACSTKKKIRKDTTGNETISTEDIDLTKDEPSSGSKETVEDESTISDVGEEAVSPESKKEIDSKEADFAESSLENFPDELILEIFVHVPGADLLSSCSLVCRQWWSIVQLQRLWKLKCQVDHHYTEKMMKLMMKNDDYRWLYMKTPYNTNLIRNSDASQGFQHWYVKKDSDWRIETKNVGEHPDPRMAKYTGGTIECWIPTYRSRSKVQIIDLIERGCTPEILDHVRPNIVIHDWYTGRYRMTIQLFRKLSDININLLTGLNPMLILDHRYWKPLAWRLHCVTETITDYPPGVRYISFRHGGRQYVKQDSYDDSCSKMIMSSVKLDLNNISGSWDHQTEENVA